MVNNNYYSKHEVITSFRFEKSHYTQISSLHLQPYLCRNNNFIISLTYSRLEHKTPFEYTPDVETSCRSTN